MTSGNASVIARVAMVLAVMTFNRTAAAQTPTAGPVSIRLKDNAVAPEGIVRLSDLAEVVGGDAATRRRIAGMDIVGDGLASVGREIARDRIQIRLLLADIRPGQFQVSGAGSVRLVAKSIGLPDFMITEAIRPEIAERLSVDPEDLSIRLMGPISPPPSLPPVDPGSIRVIPFLPSSVRLGRIRVPVSLSVDGRSLHRGMVNVEVAVFRDVATVTRRIARGEKLDRSSVRIHRVAITQPADDLPGQDVIGMHARRELKPSVTVGRRDVEAAEARNRNPMLVKPRDVVRLIARNGSLTVTINNAEVLESGRAGDLVRVRNPQSRKTLKGRVVSATRLEVDL